MPIAAGRLRHRVTLQSPRRTRTPSGAETVAWDDVVTVWAEVAPIRGREYFASAHMQDITDTRITLRYRPDIVREMRAVWRGQPYDIVSAINVRGENTELELMCITGARNGR